MVVWRQLALSIAAAALGIALGLGIWWLGSQMGDTAPLARMTSRLPVTAVLRQD
jgi:hypothetical protein